MYSELSTTFPATSTKRMTDLVVPVTPRVMKLVFIYGQAGVGKLTVGRELADLTGIALFHNPPRC